MDLYVPKSDPAKIEKIGNVTPYPFQQDVIDAVKEYVREQWGKVRAGESNRFEPGIVEAYVSAGKTIMIGALAAHGHNVGAKTLVLARTAELVEQNADEIRNMGTKCSIMCAGLNSKSVRYDVIVGSEKTVANSLDVELADHKFHQIHVDEAHHADWITTMKLLEDPNYETANCYARILAHYIRLNPKVAIIGYTGTPYRGRESIMGPFWGTRIGPKIDRDWLVANGYIVPTVFGYGDVELDFSEFDDVVHEGAEDYTRAQQEEMGRKTNKAILKKTIEITKEVMKNRIAALITCASKSQCKMVAEFLPKGSYGIVTQDTKDVERRRIIKAAKSGKLKYVMHVSCLDTGVNVPLWDVTVILRRISSPTLLIQLLGRGMRLLKPEHIDAGYEKNDHVVLDFSGTMEAMQQHYDDPMFDEADLERTKKRGDDEFQYCPKCTERGGMEYAKNGAHARRCRNVIDGERCDYFFTSILCPVESCSAENDKCAKVCRICSHELVDPNRNISGQHYTRDMWHDVKSMKLVPAKNGGLLIFINYDATGFDGKPLTAKLFFYPGSKKFEYGFVKRFVKGFGNQRKIMSMQNVDGVMKYAGLFRTPKRATYRVDERGYDIVHGLEFNDGVTMGGKRVKNN